MSLENEEWFSGERIDVVEGGAEVAEDAAERRRALTLDSGRRWWTRRDIKRSLSLLSGAPSLESPDTSCFAILSQDPDNSVRTKFTLAHVLTGNRIRSSIYATRKVGN